PNAHARAARHGTGPGDRGNDSDARIKSGGASAGECATGLCADEFGLRRAGAFPALRTAVHGGVHVAPWEAENQSGERPNARASGVVKNRPKAQVLRREKHPQPGSYCNFQKSRVQTTSGRIEPTVSGPFLSACEISGLKPPHCDSKATLMRPQSHPKATLKPGNRAGPVGPACGCEHQFLVTSSRVTAQSWAETGRERIM